MYDPNGRKEMYDEGSPGCGNEGGVILRILAFSTGSIEKLITQAYQYAREVLFTKTDLVWRKY
jgi:hypothetical protein